MNELLPEIAELNRIRLEEDRTYNDLALAIGIKDQSTLQRLLKGERQPIDRTLYKIRRFLDGRKQPSRRRRSGEVS